MSRPFAGLLIAILVTFAAAPSQAFAVANALIYDTATAFRYEDNIINLRIWNSTVGNGVACGSCCT